MDTEKLARQLDFYSIYTYLRKGQEFDEVSIKRIEEVKSVFNDIIEGLESMLDVNLPFHIARDLKEIVEATGGKYRGATILDVHQTIQKLKGYMRQLNELKNNPSEYKKEGYTNLKESCKKISDLYAENPIVLGELEDADD